MRYSKPGRILTKILYNCSLLPTNKLLKQSPKSVQNYLFTNTQQNTRKKPMLELSKSTSCRVQLPEEMTDSYVLGILKIFSEQLYYEYLLTSSSEIEVVNKLLSFYGFNLLLQRCI